MISRRNQDPWTPGPAPADLAEHRRSGLKSLYTRREEEEDEDGAIWFQELVQAQFKVPNLDG